MLACLSVCPCACLPACLPAFSLLDCLPAGLSCLADGRHCACGGFESQVVCPRPRLSGFNTREEGPKRRHVGAALAVRRLLSVLSCLVPVCSGLKSSFKFRHACALACVVCMSVCCVCMRALRSVCVCLCVRAVHACARACACALATCCLFAQTFEGLPCDAVPSVLQLWVAAVV